MGDSSQDDASNTLRILIATDCHLGYMEKDEIRRHDSFQAFEEICSIADKKQVDFLLLGGDLFHEKKPSRSTLVKAIEILRHHCMNDRPVQFQVVSDQASNFANKFGRVNYEDPYFTVGLPVFSIHGNHDDPAGADNLSAVDILSACNLVKYFGKMILEGSDVGQINLSPILIKKGLTSVAMCGLGNISDERLNRMFQTPHAVEWTRPDGPDDSEVSDWFNILVLHQNRVKSNPKNAINEHFLPQFIDFVVWGHEHECLIDPQEIPGMGFHVTQPGSSVATSLIDGESKPKHVLLLEIKGSQYRPTKIPLHSVRPFEYTKVVLKDVPDVDPNDQTSILEHLDKVVNDLIENARRKAGNKSEPKLPLVRIKVDYSGFMTTNPQRFGQKYVGKVANPQDILIFSKAPRKANNEELEHQVAAIRAIRDIETNRLLTSLRLLRSYFTEEQLQTPLLHYFEHQLPNLSISGNGKEEELNVNWKTDLPGATADIHESLLRHISLAYPDTLSMSNLHFSTDKVQPNSRISSELQFENSVMNVPSDSQLQTIGFQDGLQTPGGTGNRMSFGMTPKTLRLPKNGEILLSVHGSPLGVFREKEDNMEVINETEES